jgi:hypothetical protein
MAATSQPILCLVWVCQWTILAWVWVWAEWDTEWATLNSTEPDMAGLEIRDSRPEGCSVYNMHIMAYFDS